MRTKIVALSDIVSWQDLTATLHENGNNQPGRSQRLYPILNSEGVLKGVMTRNNLIRLQAEQGNSLTSGSQQLQAPTANDQAKDKGDGAKRSLALSTEQEVSLDHLYFDPVVAYPDEPLRVVVYRMAVTGYTCFPVVERSNPQKLVGIISLTDLLKARGRNLEEERHRERVLRLHVLFQPRNKDKIEKLS